ncbi:DNA-3-methyladenine glycosylase [Solihabitans fulvus]|uniref:Putative 3-methyladenine DNA glycosylase n=1 Tax=Solihabitans fulvus TaxID=1892852 RepID=A0A5B2WZW7_9PSEU|nr:DNA-3-methyladenine glycosylase [Solihabitans fulvus]KAA2256382.1 DNA-3-methyladenine glycosylase [Solihabitans fulvus]
MTPRLLTEQELAVDPVDAVRLLLGSVLEADSPDGVVGVRIVEVEAYRGEDDPASHCFRGRTPRNEVMYWSAGHLYVYFVYGMHFCANVVCLGEDRPGALLLRAGEVVSGVDLARSRRPAARRDSELANGPAKLCDVLGVTRTHNGSDVTDARSSVRLFAGDPVAETDIRSGPRVGIAVAMDVPWRFWVDGSPAVSAYRRGGKRPIPAP